MQRLTVDRSMSDAPPFSPLFDGLAQWTLQQGLHETTVSDLVQGFGRRLVAGGVPISRISVGGMILHPVFGAFDIVWEADHDQVAVNRVARGSLTTPEFQNTPFFQMASTGVPFLHQRLEQPDLKQNFPIFDRLRATGNTDYFAFFQSYGHTEEILWADLPPGIAGVLGAFSTRRSGGFSDMEIAYLKAMSMPLAMAIKATTTYDLAQALLDTYLGKYSGGHVLDGLVERGDGRLIDCVLWYCDLRDSTRLADETPLDDYLVTLNDYFDCTAGAVLDHGGEVLKFIGDAVMAIFPIEEVSRPAADMCRAALMTAKDALARAERLNEARSGNDLPEINFGIALHVGQVMYGNVGTDRRLDFTVIGPAANEVARLDGLSKKLQTPLVASAAFNEEFPEELAALGTHEVQGIDRGLEAFTTPELAPPSEAAD